MGQAEGLRHMLSCVKNNTRCRAWIRQRRGRGPPPRGLGAASAVSSGIADWASLAESRCLKPDAKPLVVARARAKSCCLLLLIALYQAASSVKNIFEFPAWE